MKSLNLKIRKTKLLGAYTNIRMNVAEFTNDYMDPLLEKLSREKKEITLMGGFDIHILNCDYDWDQADFVDTSYATSLYPTINIPTWITGTSKTLIDNISHNDFSENIALGSMTTSISDHLTQILVIRYQATSFEDNI